MSDDVLIVREQLLSQRCLDLQAALAAAEQWAIKEREIAENWRKRGVAAEAEVELRKADTERLIAENRRLRAIGDRLADELQGTWDHYCGGTSALVSEWREARK